MCPVGFTTRTKEAITADECRPECADGQQLDLDGNCVACPLGTFRSKGVQLACQDCPIGFTTAKVFFAFKVKYIERYSVKDINIKKLVDFYSPLVLFC